MVPEPFSSVTADRRNSSDRRFSVMEWAIYGMIYLGAALMVYNIWGFIRFAKDVQGQDGWGEERRFLYFPILLLIFFLIGYLAVALFGKPTWIIAGILFGGSIFVYVMYMTLLRVTEKVKKSERLEAQLLAAEESNRAKNNFLATMSHEMRTPMNVIIGLDALALKDETLQPLTRDHLEKIGASAHHLLDLINNVLDINSIEEGRLRFINEPFLLHDMLMQLNAISETLCSRKGLVYQFQAEDEVNRRYVSDEVRLKQLLLSLLDNAVKYTSAPGTVSFSVLLDSAEPEGTNTVRFVISDTGIGMDEEFLPKVFDVFAQEDSNSTSSYGGSGLSLAVTKRIVDQLGGTISVTSKKNAGSAFTVVIPLTLAVDPEPDVCSEPSDVSLNGKRILIAEDIPENAEIVMDLLELEGAESDHAENGKEALDLFIKSPAGYYDAVLMDLRMPVMDGLTATKEIRASSHPDAKMIPIIALTANAYESDIRDSLNAGMNAHLAKPADADLLYSTLKKYIRPLHSEGGSLS